MIAKYQRLSVSPAGRSPGETENQDDVAAWIAQRIAVDAGAQAARLKRQASAQTAAIRGNAERETEEIRRQASAQTAAIREAAEREAAELRATVVRLSAGRGMLVYADDVADAVEQFIKPTDRPVATPSRRPAAKLGARGKVNTKGRQVRAMRKVVAASVVLFLTGVTTGAVELELHGLSFFLFRNAGAGAGNSHDLNENQGPGQPDAPKPHPAAAPATQGKPPPGDRVVPVRHLARESVTYDQQG